MRPNQGKAANQAVLDRQGEIEQFQEQYAKKEQESKTAEEANLQPRRYGAGGVTKALIGFGIRYGSTPGRRMRKVAKVPSKIGLRAPKVPRSR